MKEKLKFKKILIANRGEIAVRIMRTLRRMNIRSVAVYADNDEKALHVSMADESISLGSGTLADTYLNVEKIISAAKSAGAQAVHPGYGFLSESPLLTKACALNGISFIGPTEQSIALMGNKITARQYAVDAGLPVTKGITGNPDELLQNAAQLPFPLLVKAASGGGGKGMRIVRNADELPQILESTAREAQNYFGDDTIYIEQFIENPRHIEIQVLADHHGNVIHLFERECSIQRRYQKIIEESPSPTLSPEVRQKMGEAAVAVCKKIGYQSAGTIEFLVDAQLNFYFLEMNTRIQVEHPVTELVTGVDLIEEQVLITQGEPLRYQQADIRQCGHAVECRIYAENPSQQFMPSPGEILAYREPDTENIRIDSSLNNAATVHSQYDPMISKLIGYGTDRSEAIRTCLDALKNYVIHGIHTNIPFLMAVLQNEAYLNNKISTGFCDAHLDTLINRSLESEKQTDHEFIAATFLLHNLNYQSLEGIEPANVWQEIGYWRNDMEIPVRVGENSMTGKLQNHSSGQLLIEFDNKTFDLKFSSWDGLIMQYKQEGQSYQAAVSKDAEGRWLVQYDGTIFNCERL
ncbi:MAG TPA: biotin carboxylase N-terminal domain-containing protein, partial [Bacteroidales bacterium]|nr:biotin carboxylase N-terminal domain-containing protein [Bacteroidales bacterium]